jgi:hypothetical protein
MCPAAVHEGCCTSASPRHCDLPISFVCATSKETGDTVCLASYRSPRSDNSDLLNATTIWQACHAEGHLRQSLAGYASKIPKGYISDRSRDAGLNSEKDVDIVVADVLDWLGRPDNVGWLLVFDNVDQDFEQVSEIGAYDIWRYLPGDYGSVLITTRLARVAQLGDSRRLRNVDEELGKAIFQQWYRYERELGMLLSAYGLGAIIT